MSTELHVAAAGLVVTGCLAIGYGLYLASTAIIRVSDVAVFSGVSGMM